MKSKNLPKILAVNIALLLVDMSLSVAHAAPLTFDNGSANQLWSDPGNWNPDSAPAGNEITFDGTASSTVAGTVTNIVDASLSINTLIFNNTGTNTHTTQINSGQTLTVSGTGSAVQISLAVTAVNTTANFTGPGAFAVTGGTAANFNVGATLNAAGSAVQTLDLSGLTSFSANVGNLSLGTGTRQAGIVSLGVGNTITVGTTLTVGGNTAAGGAQSILNLGQANAINASTITIGLGRDSGLLQFKAGLSNPTATFRNAAGTAGGNLNIGTLDTNASTGPTSAVDFGGGTIDALFGTVVLGRSANSTAGGSATGNLTFGAGTLGVTTNLRIGVGNNGSSATATGIGNFTMSLNAGTLTALLVTVGDQTTTGANAANGTFAQNGGTAAITTLTLGQRTSTNAAGGNVNGTYNLAGGTLKAQTIQAGSNGTAGTTVITRTFNWTGGTIQNLNSATDLAISTALTLGNNSGTLTFSADTGRTITASVPIGESLVGSGFTKAGLGGLTVSGANTYSGLTNVTNGTLATSGSGTLGTGNITLQGTNPVILTLGSPVSFGNSSVFTFAGNSTINLNFSGDDTLGSITNGSLTAAPGSYTATQLNSFFGTTQFMDSGALGGTLTVVPEPNTWMMLAGSFGMALGLRRNRRRLD